MNYFIWLAKSIGAVARALGTVLAWMVFGSFVAVTAVSILWKLDSTPIQGLDGAAASLPSQFYSDMISFEVALLPPGEEDGGAFSTRNVTAFLTRLTTGIDPADPRTLTAQLLPGGHNEGSIILVKGIGTGPADYPVEVPPAPHLLEPSDSIETPIPDTTADEEAPQPAEEPPAGTGQPAGPNPDESKPDNAEEEQQPQDLFFVYHSHPDESFLPELNGITKIDEAYENKDKERTITAVGKRLADSLIEKGIGAIHSDKKYPWNTAYNESRKTVKAAMQQHEDLQYFIDIHRDSARKEKTVLDANGTSYARVYFVVGQKNPDYEKNQALANELHYRLEEKVQGISRGVVGKKAGSNGEFNQSLSPNSILIEVGGVDNTLEQCFRTADLLADVFAELYWEKSDAVRANAGAN